MLVRYWIRATVMEIACLGYSYKDYYINVLVILSSTQFCATIYNLPK